MLTEPQFKVLMILFDDKGHAGWQLAEYLNMKASNLNHYLKDLEERKFVVQGHQRKSTRPKKRSDGDYKEIPYYLNKDLNILQPLIKEMVVTNKSYDTGFPFRVIKLSNFMKSMRDIYKENFHACMRSLSKELNAGSISPSWTSPIPISKNESVQVFYEVPEELHFLNRTNEKAIIEERFVSDELLKELEIWWLRYTLTMYCNKDPIDINQIIEILNDNKRAFDRYILGDDIWDVISDQINKLPNKDSKALNFLARRNLF